MKVTAKITKNFTDAGKLKAFATVCLADAFLVTGVRGVEQAARAIAFCTVRFIRHFAITRCLYFCCRG